MTGRLLSSKVLWIGATGIVLLFYFLFNPEDHSWMPQCFFHKMTGLKCMGCGSQRMLYQLLHGNFREAWEANRLLVISLPFLAFLVGVELTRTSFPDLYKKIHTKNTMIIITATLLAWLLIRNIFGF